MKNLRIDSIAKFRIRKVKDRKSILISKGKLLRAIPFCFLGLKANIIQERPQEFLKKKRMDFRIVVIVPHFVIESDISFDLERKEQKEKVCISHLSWRLLNSTRNLIYYEITKLESIFYIVLSIAFLSESYLDSPLLILLWLLINNGIIPS